MHLPSHGTSRSRTALQLLQDMLPLDDDKVRRESDDLMPCYSGMESS